MVTVERLGIPNKFRRQHGEFEQVGIDEVQERMRKKGSRGAVVRSREKNISHHVHKVLLDHQIVAFALYCHGKVVGRGQPSLTRSETSIDGGSIYDGTPVSSANNNISGPNEFDLMCIGIAKYIDSHLSYHIKFVATGLWRAAFPQEDLTNISWQAISEHFTKSKCPKQKEGALKTYMGITTSEMARLLQNYWKKNPPSQYCKDRINLNVSEIFAL